MSDELLKIFGLELDLQWLMPEEDLLHLSETNITSTIAVDLEWHYEAEDSGLMVFSRKLNRWTPSSEKSPTMPVAPTIGRPSEINQVFWNQGSQTLAVRQSTVPSLIGNLLKFGLSIELFIIARGQAKQEQAAWKKAAQEMSKAKPDRLASVAVRIDYYYTWSEGGGTYWFQRLNWVVSKTRDEAKKKIMGPGIYGVGLLNGPPNRVRLVEIYPVGEPRKVLREAGDH